MKLRTFTAPDMPSAMQMVRDELGDEAIILSTKPVINGKRGISVTAAIDKDDDDRPPQTSSPKPGPLEKAEHDTQLADLRFELQNILRFHNLPELFIAKFLQKAADSELASIMALHRLSSSRTPQQLHKLALERLVAGFFSFHPLPLDATPTRLMLIGMPGIGKTLTIAKIASRLAMDNQPLSVITTDNKRAGGIEQLQSFTDILGLTLNTASTREELQSLLASLSAYTRVLIDTAGCNPYEEADIRELKGYTTLKGIEPVLVMPAGGDSLEAIDMAETFCALNVKRLLVTQADTARRYGSVLAVAAAHRLAFCNISMSSSILDTLKPADSALLAQILLKYQYFSHPNA